MCFSEGNTVAKRDGVTTRIVSGHQDAEGTVGNCNCAKKCLGARQQLVKLAPRSNQEFYVSDSLGWHDLRSLRFKIRCRTTSVWTRSAARRPEI